MCEQVFKTKRLFEVNLLQGLMVIWHKEEGRDSSGKITTDLCRGNEEPHRYVNNSLYG